MTISRDHSECLLQGLARKDACSAWRVNLTCGMSMDGFYAEMNFLSWCKTYCLGIRDWIWSVHRRKEKFRASTCSNNSNMRRRFLDQSKHYMERTCNISMILCLTKTNDSIRLDYLLSTIYDIPTHFLDDGKDRLIPLNRTIARIHDLRVQESGILPASLGEHWGVLKASRVLATNPVGDGKSSSDHTDFIRLATSRLWRRLCFWLVDCARNFSALAWWATWHFSPCRRGHPKSQVPEKIGFWELWQPFRASSWEKDLL